MSVLLTISLMVPFFFLSAEAGCAADVPYDTAATVQSGNALFQTYCRPCHSVHKEIIGPMLASVTKKQTEAWLIAFIRNSQDIILTGDTYANFLFERYNRTVMPSFKEFSDQQIKDILLYIEKESVVPTEEIEPMAKVNLDYMRQDVVQGKALFDAQCASCHFIEREGYGPALGSVTKRRPKSWLISFVKNSQQVIHSGDYYSVHLFNEFDKKVMVKMEFLNEDEIISILKYIEFISASPRVEAGENGRKKQAVQAFAYYNNPDRPGVEKEGKPFFKIFFIVVSALAAVVHGYVTVRLFWYLFRK